MASTATATDFYPSPVTPRDSESEDRPADAMPARKRNASEMNGGQDQKPRKKHISTKGARKPKRLLPGSSRRVKGSTAPRTQETIEAEKKIDTTFTVECPVWPDSKRYKGRLSRENLYTERDAPSLPGLKHLGIDFSVKPGTVWSKLGLYKNAKFKDPVEVTYSAGEIVYVNRHSPIPPAPATDASEDEKLAYDQENFWVALIAGFRAENQESVYVQVFWLYWPDELPMGRQPYHGKQELVMSNHVDIVEAQAIACHTNISHWDENDDSNKVVLLERYWRQTYDLAKMATAPQHALSRLRKFCICGGHDNPGREMYQCHNADCGMWNHQACLIATFEQRAWESFQKGQLTHEVEEQPKTLGQKVADTVGHVLEETLVKVGVKGEGAAVKNEPNPDISMGSKKAKLVAASKRPWSDKLMGSVTRTQTSADKITHRASVKQLVPAFDTKRRASFSPKTWNMELNCMRCQHPLN